MTVIRSDINDLLMQMRDMKQQASGGVGDTAGMNKIQPRSDVEAALGVEKSQATPNFTEMFTTAIDSVNETQKTSSALAKAYEQGDPSISLSQVMVASQKSSVAFEAMSQVRNKLVEAYKDVMKMPV